MALAGGPSTAVAEMGVATLFRASEDATSVEVTVGGVGVTAELPMVRELPEPIPPTVPWNLAVRVCRVTDDGELALDCRSHTRGGVRYDVSDPDGRLY